VSFLNTSSLKMFERLQTVSFFGIEDYTKVFICSGGLSTAAGSQELYR
jgi:hypothetical protein